MVSVRRDLTRPHSHNHTPLQRQQLIAEPKRGNYHNLAGEQKIDNEMQQSPPAERLKHTQQWSC